MTDYTQTVEYLDLRERVGEEIKQKVRDAANHLKGEYYESRQGVPLVILPWWNAEDHRRGQADICWFQKKKHWTFFYPYPSFGRSQTRMNFKTIEEFEVWYRLQTLSQVFKR